MALEIVLAGKRALVTGATSGVGLGIAGVLARAGCVVAGCGRSSEESQGASDFRSAVEDGCGAGHYFQCDMTDAAQVVGLAARVAGVLGGLDVVVSNAGVNVFEGAAECSEDDWQRNMELNLASHWRLAKAARRFLSAGPDPGSFIVITSNHAHQTIAGCFPYNVAKTALTGLVRALALEWGPQVRCVGVAPGFIETEGNRKWFESFDDPAAERARTEALHPVGRIGTAEEVGALCAFLSSSHGAFISGTTIVQDGGRSAVLQDGHPFGSG